MSRAALLAVLLALSLPMGAAAAPADEPATAALASAPADVPVLTLDGSTRLSFGTGSIDVATALAAERDAAAVRLDSYAMAERFRRTDSREARQRLLFATIADAGADIDALHGEERQLRAAYLNGSIDAETFVRRLARLTARAGALRATVGHIREFDERMPRFTLRRRIDRLDGALFGLDGRVRELALAAVRGDEPATRLYVEAHGDGVVLAAIDGERHVREAYRADSRDRGNTSDLDFSEAVSVTERLYAPYAFNDSNSIGYNFDDIGDTYRLIMELEGGTIEAYLDGVTGRVFFEVRERRLDQVSSPDAAVGSANGTRLVANRTYPGGPLRLAVSDNETGEPLAATVHVGDWTVRTGDDGVAWTLAPRNPVEVTAVGPRGNVTVAVRPLAPTPVYGREG